ncbi:MAG: hypothetical protein H6921_14645 [Sphingomonas sp.]|nr:hypothetical protein [Sphingomonas sp.]
MPRMTDRERLAKIEADQRRLAEEAERTRQAVRAHYGSIVADVAVETLTEREFRDILNHVVRLGGSAAVSALKAHPTSP